MVKSVQMHWLMSTFSKISKKWKTY